MRLIIDIPKDVYKETLRTEIWNEYEKRAIRFAIRNCTILPKGHGDLVDRACLYDFRDWLNTCPKDCDEDDEIWFTSTEVINKIKQYSAVIDADKTESEL